MPTESIDCGTGRSIKIRYPDGEEGEIPESELGGGISGTLTEVSRVTSEVVIEGVTLQRIERITFAGASGSLTLILNNPELPGEL